MGKGLPQNFKIALTGFRPPLKFNFQFFGLGGMTYFGSYDPPGVAKKKDIVNKVGKHKRIIVFPRGKPD